MKILKLLDSKNYSESMEEIKRTAIRAITFKEDKLLLLGTNTNDINFPGGGMENDEDDIETLIRETREETGYIVDPDSVKEFGELIEKRLSFKEPKIWHQFNRFYLCDVNDDPVECKYTPHEIRLGFHPIWITVDEAISICEKRFMEEGKTPFNQREYEILLLIKESLNK